MYTYTRVNTRAHAQKQTYNAPPTKKDKNPTILLIINFIHTVSQLHF